MRPSSTSPRPRAKSATTSGPGVKSVGHRYCASGCKVGVPLARAGDDLEAGEFGEQHFGAGLGLYDGRQHFPAPTPAAVGTPWLIPTAPTARWCSRAAR